MPKISVIIPFYKEIYLIDRAIKSVVLQNLPKYFEIEVIIGNDSKYSESQIRSFLSKDSNSISKIAKNNNENGAGFARNAAIELSEGDYLAFLDADDYWTEGKLEEQLKKMEAGANFVTTQYTFENTTTIITPPKKVSSTFELLCNTTTGTSTIIITKKLLGNSRFKNIKTTQDTELWARLAGKSDFKYTTCDFIGTIYSPSDRTSNKFTQLIKFAAVLKNFNLNLSQKSIILFRYSARGILNHYIKKKLLFAK